MLGKRRWTGLTVKYWKQRKLFIFWRIRITRTLPSKKTNRCRRVSRSKMISLVQKLVRSKRFSRRHLRTPRPWTRTSSQSSKSGVCGTARETKYQILTTWLKQFFKNKRNTKLKIKENAIQAFWEKLSATLHYRKMTTYKLWKSQSTESSSWM